MNNNAITVKNLTRSFRLPHEQRDSMKERLFNFFRPVPYEVINAACDLTFSIPKGDFLGIIGRNGAGKSTLLKLLSGIVKPDSGSIEINGRIAPFIELDVGFQPSLSGRDNVFLYGALLGMTRKQLKNKYNDIVRFAELERFMDQKVKNYSTGMKLRLGFAITAYVDADIIIVDEFLAVGDTNFQKKCYKEIQKFKEAGKTLILVSHDFEQIKSVCNNVLWLRSGKMQKLGSTESILSEYLNVL